MSDLTLASDRNSYIGEGLLLFNKRECFGDQPHSCLRPEFTLFHFKTFYWTYWLIQGIWGHTERKEGIAARCIKLRRKRGGIQAPLFGAAENIPVCNASSCVARTQLFLVPVAVAQKYYNCEHGASTLPLQLLLWKIDSCNWHNENQQSVLLFKGKWRWEEEKSETNAYLSNQDTMGVCKEASESSSHPWLNSCPSTRRKAWEYSFFANFGS